MRRGMTWGYGAAFLAVCVAVIAFLLAFTRAEPSLTYLSWTEAWTVDEAGEAAAFDPAGPPPALEEGGFYRFSATLPAGRANGDWLIFETAGSELAVYLDGEELWRSASLQAEGTVNLGQAQLPLPGGGGETLTMEVRPLTAELGLFPPLPRLTADPTDQAGAMAYANYYGIPAGASALALVLVWGLFLLGLVNGERSPRPLLLALAAAGFTIQNLCQGSGTAFVPPALLAVLTSWWAALLPPLVLALYLALQRRRAFWRRLGIAAAGSAAAMTAACLLSAAWDGMFHQQLLRTLDALVRQGAYTQALYWGTLWLLLVCTALAAWDLARAFAAAQGEARALRLRNDLALDSYRALEEKLREGATLRHEAAHRLAALDALYQSGDWAGLGRLLEDLGSQSARLSRSVFSRHFALNAMLQDADARAAAAGVAFEARVEAPEDLPIPTEDLCVLLMNMLDNALEAAARVEKPEERFIRFRAAVRESYLAVRCENSYVGPLRHDEQGRLRTTKADEEVHGLGLSQMSAVAKRYKSLLDVSYSERVFTVQTALKLPERGGARKGA